MIIKRINCTPCGSVLHGSNGIVKCSNCGATHHISENQVLWIQQEGFTEPPEENATNNSKHRSRLILEFLFQVVLPLAYKSYNRKF